MRNPHPLLWSVLLFVLFPALATALSINLPLPHTLHAANVNLLVTWGDVGTVTTVNILLAKDEGKTIIATLANNVDAGSKSANVKMPSETPNGSDYYIVLQGNDNTSASRGPFTVIFGGDGSSMSSAAPSSSSSAVPSSASNSASSSSVASSSSSISSSQSSSASSSSDSNSPTATSDDSKDGENDNQGLTSGQVAGIVVGVVGAFAVVQSLIAIQKKNIHMTYNIFLLGWYCRTLCFHDSTTT